MEKKTDYTKNLPKKGMRAVTFTLAAIYLVLFLVLALVKFPGGEGESIMVRLLLSLFR